MAESDFGTNERWQHDPCVLEECDPKNPGQKRVRAQYALDRYFSRGQLSKNEDENATLYSVGREYAELSFRAGLHGTPKTINMLAVPGGMGDNELAHAALQRIRRAQMHVGISHTSILDHVCVYDWTAKAWAAARGYDDRVGIAFLIDALRCVREVWGR